MQLNAVAQILALAASTGTIIMMVSGIFKNFKLQFDKKFDEQERRFELRFAQIDKRFEQVELRHEAFERHFEELDNRIFQLAMGKTLTEAMTKKEKKIKSEDKEAK